MNMAQHGAERVCLAAFDERDPGWKFAGDVRGVAYWPPKRGNTPDWDRPGDSAEGLGVSGRGMVMLRHRDLGLRTCRSTNCNVVAGPFCFPDAMY